VDKWADLFKADLADLIKWAEAICIVVCMGNNLTDTSDYAKLHYFDFLHLLCD